ncbi:MAG: hypothetical protein WD875_17115, partial [Pirellulales bacterium]
PDPGEQSTGKPAVFGGFFLLNNPKEGICEHYSRFFLRRMDELVQKHGSFGGVPQIGGPVRRSALGEPVAP